MKIKPYVGNLSFNKPENELQELLALVGTVMWKAWGAAAGHPTAFNVAVWIALLAALMHNMVEASFEGQQFQVVFWAVAAMAGGTTHDARGNPRLKGEA